MDTLVEEKVDKEQLREIIADTLDVDEEEVSDTAHFIDDLGVDSVMALEVSVVLEKRYGVKIKEEDLLQISCLEKVLDLLNEKLKD